MSLWHAPVWEGFWHPLWTTTWKPIETLLNTSTYFDGAIFFNVNFVGDEPFTGDVYNGALLIGNRSALTGDFTPDAGVPTAELIEDLPSPTNEILIDDGIAVHDDGEFTFDP